MKSLLENVWAILGETLEAKHHLNSNWTCDSKGQQQVAASRNILITLLIEYA